ncbi:hypothetical protein BH10PLA1_BH10PLA1_20910 [soil metagenome]
MKFQYLAPLLLLLLAGCHTAPPPSSTAETDVRGLDEPKAVDDPESWAQINKVLGLTGVYAREVFTITIPREDIDVINDMGDIPSAAGMDTTIYFFKCSCGRTRVVGRFVVVDYEANDVINELQTDGIIKIASLSPIFLREKPRMMAIQFQGEGDAEKLATLIKGALSYTAEARMTPATQPAE